MLVRPVVRTRHAVFAILLEPLGAARTVLARVHHAADSHEVARAEAFHVGTSLDHSTHDLVAGYARVDRSGPLAACRVQVRVADTAEQNVDADVLRTGVASFEGEGAKGRIRTRGRISGSRDHSCWG